MKRALGWACAVGVVLASCSLIDLDVPREYPCTPGSTGGDAGTQCPASYRCGLEARCHPVGVARPYRCVSDSDCEAQWRCGPEAVCVDPSQDALRATQTASAPTVTRFHPRTATEHAEHFAAGSRYDLSWCTDQVSGIPTLTATDAGIVAMYLWEGGRPATATGALPGCGQTPDELRFVDVATAALPSQPVVDLAITQDRGIALLAGGRYCTFTYLPGQPLSVICPTTPLGFPATHLRVGTGEPLQVLAFDSQRYTVIHLDTLSSIPARQIPAFDGGIADINDLLMQTTSEGLHPLLAATPQGVMLSSLEQPAPFVGPDADGGWQLADTDDYCQAAYNQAEPASAFALIDYQSALLVVRPRSSYDTISVLDRLYPGPDDGGVPLCAPVPTSGWYSGGFGQEFLPADHARACRDLCADYGEHLDFLDNAFYSPESTSTGPSTAVPQTTRPLRTVQRCVTDAGTPGHTLINPLACDYPSANVPHSARYERPFVTSHSDPGVAAFSDDLGHAYVDHDQRGLVESLALDRAPTAVFGDLDGGLLLATSDLTSGLGYGNKVIGEGQIFGFEPSSGLASQGPIGGASIDTAVDGQPRWGLAKFADDFHEIPLSIVLFDFPPALVARPRVLAVGKVGELFARPFHGAFFTSLQGNQIALITSGDALLASDVTGTVADAGSFDSDTDFATMPQLEVKAIPLPRNDIQAIIALPRSASDAGTPLFAEGYLLASGRLFRFQAPNSVVWKTDELLLPDGVASALFRDGARGRIGYTDGRVFSLPTRVPLAPALPAAAGSAVDYAQLCENAVVMAQHGLYRLVVAAGQTEGTWQPIDLPTAQLPGGSNDFTGGKLAVAGSELLVFHPLGWAYRLTGLQCAGP